MGVWQFVHPEYFVPRHHPELTGIAFFEYLLASSAAIDNEEAIVTILPTNSLSSLPPHYRVWFHKNVANVVFIEGLSSSSDSDKSC